MKSSGRYIDMLFINSKKYVIVEIKCTFISEISIVTDQVLEYRKSLSEEIGVAEDNILCSLVTPKGFSKEVISFCENIGVITKKIDEKEIINFLPSYSKEKGFDFNNNSKKYIKILRNRLDKKSNFKFDENQKDIKVFNEVESIKNWINKGYHDEVAKKRIAEIFIEISENAPIRAHEVNTSNNGKLIDNYDMWFWLFYSVMDRRSNAANFINAKKALEKKDIFSPRIIIKIIKEKDEKTAIIKIARILKNSGFPLMRDSSMGDLAFPRSIVEAAKLISKYDYDFDRFYKHHLDNSNGQLNAAYKTIKKEIEENIYGVGPRISSQFIRGMVLKGTWDLPLNDDKLLEKCEFNVRFASKIRLGLIEDENHYSENLGRFADEYLDGNRAIISHALWYIRKKYCDKKIMCDECKLSGYCAYFLKTQQISPIKQDLSMFVS